MGQKHQQRGLTLLELVVVLVLLSVAVGLVFQRVGGTSEVREAKMFAKELAILLKKARRTAVNSGGPVTVWISAAERTCSIEEDVRLEIPEFVRIDGKKVRHNEEGIPYIRFDPDGGSSGGELIVLIDQVSVAAMRIDMFTAAIQNVREDAGGAG
ncbi:MAG: GspH/FimT family protein [Thermodesulfobacteriota bacterium]